MRFFFLVNDTCAIAPTQTTAMLIAAAAKQHEVWVGGVADLSCHNDGQPWVWAKQVEPSASDSCQRVVTALSTAPQTAIALTRSQIDLWIMRTNPARDLDRSALHSAALTLAQRAEQLGVCVLNKPTGLLRAASKLYLLELPAFTRPPTLVSPRREEIVEFIQQLDGPAVLKPLQGTRGNDVFFIESATDANLNQIIDVILRQGLVMAQGCIPNAAAGDTRVVVMNGKILETDGQAAAIRRVPKSGDFRSNIHAGGSAAPGAITDSMREVVSAIGPQLVQTGLFLVGLDFIGAQLLEVNVFSTGGLRDAERFTGQAFASQVIEQMAAQLACS